MSLDFMVDAARDVARFARGDKEAWHKDSDKKAALRSHLARLGSAVAGVDEKTRRQDQAIPWDALGKFPELVSDLYAVDDEAVWGTAVATTALISKLEALAGSDDPGVV